MIKEEKNATPSIVDTTPQISESTLVKSEFDIPIENIVIHDEEILDEREPGILAEREYSEMQLFAKLQQKKNKLRIALKEKGILPKGAHNDYDNYEYFSEAQYKELFTELFSEYGIELFITEAKYESFKGTDKQPFGRLVTLTCTLIDIDTGFTESSNHTGEGLDRGDKAGYKATTGALKRFLSSTFLVATKDDPEREDEKPNGTTPVTKKITKGTITPTQNKTIRELFKDDKVGLSKIMKSLKKLKVEELSTTEASKIIKDKRGE